MEQRAPVEKLVKSWICVKHRIMCLCSQLSRPVQNYYGLSFPLQTSGIVIILYITLGEREAGQINRTLHFQEINCCSASSKIHLQAHVHPCTTCRRCLKDEQALFSCVFRTRCSVWSAVCLSHQSWRGHQAGPVQAGLGTDVHRVLLLADALGLSWGWLSILLLPDQVFP